MNAEQRRRVSWACAATLGVLAAVRPETSSAEDWKHTLFVYGMGAALDGDASVGPLTVPVDLEISDVFDALEFGAMAAYRVSNDTWSFTADMTFMGLGATATGHRQGVIEADVDVDQTTFMATVGRRITPHLEALLSLGYVDLSTDLRVSSTGPDGRIDETASAGADWIDPMLGLQYSTSFADDWRLNLRGDVGGFGVGADLTYQLLGNLRWNASERMGVAFGYRLIAFDYEDGDEGTAHYQRYDLTEQGPFVGVTIEF